MNGQPNLEPGPIEGNRIARGIKPRGQAYALVALGMVVLCGVLALAVDVGVTNADYQSLRHAADNAADAGAFTLYGKQIGTNSATDTNVWSAMASRLTAAGYTVKNAVGSAVPNDPCTAGYVTDQIAMTATYLSATNMAITTTGTAPWTVGSGSIPPGALGVRLKLGMCQLPGFGAVLGHPFYTIWVQASAGRPVMGPTATPGPTLTPTATSSPTASPTSTPLPSNTPTATSTNTATSTATPVTYMPFAASAAPIGDCSSSNHVPAAAGGDTELFYCPGSYSIGSSVTVYANGKGQGNDYGHDSSFKGYIGGIYPLNTLQSTHTGGGNNEPSSCPDPMSVPIISGVHHSGSSEYFVVLETIVIHVTGENCGNPTTGTILSVYDPYGFGVVSAPAPTATPTATATSPPTSTATNTPTSTSTPTSTATSTPSATPTWSAPGTQ